MRLTLSRIVTLLLLPAAVGIALPSASQTVSIIFSFSGQASSGYPVFVVPAQGTDGNFYGTTSLGGASNNGVLFKVSPNGTYTALHEFAGGTDGANPTAPPIVASDGNLYGS